MRRSLLGITFAALAAVALGGCDSEEKKPDPPQAKAKPVAPPAEEPQEDNSIVIKGSKRDDAPKQATEEDEYRLKRRAELEAAARNSQGKGEGGTASSADSKRVGDELTALRRKQLKQQILDDDAKIARLQAEKKSLEATRHQARGMTQKYYTDPDRAAAIDQEVASTEADKKQAQTDLAALPADPKTPPTKKNDGSGSQQPKGDASSSNTDTANTASWGTAFQASLDVAKAQGKLVLADFTGSDW